MTAFAADAGYQLRDSMHILWLILKIILMALGILLGILLALLLLLLFVPVVYRVDLQVHNRAEVNARVSWMSFFLDLRAHYKQADSRSSGENEFYYYLRSFWALLATNDSRRLSAKAEEKKNKADLRRRKSKKKSVRGKSGRDKKADIPTIEVEASEHVWEADLEPWEDGTKAQEEWAPWRFIRRFFWGMEILLTFPARLPAAMYGIWRKVQAAMDNFSNVLQRVLETLKLVDKKRQQIIKLYGLPTTKTAIVNCKGYLLDLLSHLKPKKLEGQLVFGMKDPALTGQIFGILGLLLPIYYDNIDLAADFEGQRLEGDIHMRGSITIAYLLWLLLKIYRDKYTMKTYERIKKISGGKNDGK